MSTPASEPGLAVVVGSTGGLGAALLDALREGAGFARVLGLSRAGTPPLDLLDEASVAAAARVVAEMDVPLRLLVDATGFLHGEGMAPERSWRDIDARHLARAFAVNAIGPALLLKHFLPLLPAQGRAVFATLSARVGSIGDNRLGGWYAYRASKAALNQLVASAAVELRRRRPQALCVALHPGTVATGLSAPFARGGLEVRAPALAAREILGVIAGLAPAQSGGFFDHRGAVVPW